MHEVSNSLATSTTYLETNMKFGSKFRLATLALCACLHVTAAVAQSFPTKPVRIISPSPPGGATDNTMRLIATELSKMWGQPVVIDNKPGGTGLVSQQAMMASPNDGYVLAMQNSGFMIATPLAHGDQYSNVTGVTPIAFVSEYPLVLATSGSNPANDWKELASALTRSGRPTGYGTSGVGGTPHLAGELIRRASKLELSYVPYKGDAAMLTDILGGHLTMGLPIMGSALPHYKSGKVKFIGVLSESRAPFAPEVPTLKEQGIDVSFTPWSFLIGPIGMPADVVAKINRDVNAILRLPAIKEYFTNNALIMHETSVEQVRARIKTSSEVGQNLIRELKIPLN
jgi:tripartite-type tricarboxylate transporter receptor subunit TctC